MRTSSTISPTFDRQLGKDGTQLAPHHHPYQVGPGDLAHRPRANQGAVAQGRGPIGDLGKLLQPVRDVDDANPVSLQVANHAEQVLDFVVAERCGGLVHDQDASLCAEARAISTSCCSGIDSRRDLAFGVDGGADPIEKTPGAVAPRSPSNTPPATAGLQPQRDVLGDRQVREERRLLIDRRDPKRPGPRGIERGLRPAS